MPAGPGSGPRTSVGQARAGSLQCCGRCSMTWATSAGDTSSQVCPKARPASCPAAHTSAPAPAVAPRPTARSWSPGLVNGGASGGRWPPGGSGGQESCHIRLTPRDAAVAVASGALGGEENAVFLQVGRDEEPQGGVATPVVRPSLLSMAVPAPAGEAASPIGIELVDGLGGPAGWAALAGGPAGHAGVGTLVAHLGGSFQV